MATDSAPIRWRVPYVSIDRHREQESEELHRAFDRVLARGDYVGGEAVANLEAELAAYCGVKHAVALNSGTDALMLGMMALGITTGDEVIVPPNSFIASAASVVHLGARPVFADVQPDQNLDPAAVAKVLSSRTKAIMAVHLTGRIAPMSELKEIAGRHNLALIEDAAQAIGSMYHGKHAGAIGDFGCFSAHPLKNLNAMGDGGFLTTDRDDIKERVVRLRNHGLIDRDTAAEFGFNSRLDTLQAEIVRLRLKRLPDVIERRRANAARYQSKLDPSHVFAPPCRNYEFNTFHTFVVQVDRRDALRARLAERGIGSAIHYPVPIHLQPAAAALGHGKGDFPQTEQQAQRILSLPINQFLSDADIDLVADTVNAFFSRN